MQAKKDYPHVRLFKSDFMESFSFVHPITPALIFLPLLFLLFYFDNLPLWQEIGAVFCGLLWWTLFEYLMHRFVFHFISKKNLIRRFTFLMHGIHHKDPNDPWRLVAPPIMSLSVGCFLFLLVFVPFHPLWRGLMAGVMAGYLMYDYLHYYFHHFTPKNAYLKYLRKNHFLHHFKTPKKKYGVSSPLWDFIFRTY